MTFGPPSPPRRPACTLASSGLVDWSRVEDDFELLDRWRAGDSDAGKALLHRYAGKLFRFFTNKIDGSVDDLVQDTLLACIEGRDRFRRDAGFDAYVFGIARNVFFAFLRRRGRASEAFDPATSSLQDMGPTPSEFVARKKEEQLLLLALRRLPVDDQLLLELYHRQGLTGTELAVVLGIGERAVRSRLHRAKQALHDQLAEQAESPVLLRSTWADFESWARELPRPDEAT